MYSYVFCVFTVKSVFRKLSFLKKNDGSLKRKPSKKSFKQSLSEEKEEKVTTEKFQFKTTEIPQKPCSGKSLQHI